MEKFAEGKVRARRYRNRRIGGFLKELELSEKQSTGISKILRELKRNGSPLPEFETDEGRHYMITTIRMRGGFEKAETNLCQKNDRRLTEVLNEVLPQKQYEKVQPLVTYLETHKYITPKEAKEIVGKSTSTVYRYLELLKEVGIVEVSGSTNNIVYRRAEF